MNRDETKAVIAVMQHFADGGEVQSRYRTGDGCWADNVNPHWCWDTCEYRIKPKPLECWVWVPSRKSVELRICGGWVEESELPTEPDYINGGGRWVRMREVTNETDD